LGWDWDVVILPKMLWLVGVHDISRLGLGRLPNDAAIIAEAVAENK